VGELQGVRNEVEHDSAERRGIADAGVHLWQLCIDGESLLFCDRLDETKHAIEQFRNREWNRLAIEQTVAAARQLDDVAHELAQPHGRGLIQTQVPFFPTASASA